MMDDGSRPPSSGKIAEALRQLQKMVEHLSKELISVKRQLGQGQNGGSVDDPLRAGLAGLQAQVGVLETQMSALLDRQSGPSSGSHGSNPSGANTKESAMENRLRRLEMLALTQGPLSGADPIPIPVSSPDSSEQLSELMSSLSALEQAHHALAEQLNASLASPKGTLSVDDPAAELARDRRPRLDAFLRRLVEAGGSDMHLSVTNAPQIRQSGDLMQLPYPRLTLSEFRRLMRPITPTGVWDRFEASGDADFAYQIPELARFRVNLLRTHFGGGAVFRVIPTEIKTVEALGLPAEIHRATHIRSGLVLVTGPTGSGKSTTLAAVFNEINERETYHIITLEDPIEFVHPPKRCLIHQREVGKHATDFNSALRAAVREDPDMLLVGEMRDVETIRLALDSAEKGLLVFGTLHTNNAAKTVDRIINSFPLGEQSSIRGILADSLRCVVAQQLLKRVGGGRVAAVELLFGSTALGNLIREGKSHQITSMIQTNRRQGMISMDDALKSLVNRGLIEQSAAFEKAIDKKAFEDPELRRLEEQALSESERRG